MNQPRRRFEALRRAAKAVPGAIRVYQWLRPPPEVLITRYLREGARLIREHGLTEAAVTAEGGFFRSPWGAEFVYVPGWGAYGAERGMLHEMGELEYLARTLPRGAVVIDVGANLGAFSLNLAVRRPDLTVHAFEPVGATNGYLRANVRRNGLEGRVTTHRAAVSEKPGSVRITNRKNTDNHLVPGGEAAGASHEEVPAVTLDDFVAKEGVRGVALLKMDVEGAELLGLRGATTLLREQRPELFLEVQEEHLARFGESIASLVAFLAAQGYAEATPPEFLSHNRLFRHTAGRPGGAETA
ncbi:MAG TPA: FkbM family methyltransferase [Longimicrobium sp.]|nr:FkbM family methyltransferase [Longimicrobium sp.]